MNNKIVLSIDNESLQKPDLIMLENISLDQDWLKVYTSADKFRNFINHCPECREIWIVSNDDIEAINLAATAKKDRPDCIVCLVSYDLSGSLQSRANAANIDRIISLENLRERLLARIQKEKSEDNMTLADIPGNVPQVQNHKKAFVLSVVSATGGSGKSVVSALCALLCQLSGKKTLVIDADFQFGEIDFIFGQENPIHIDELINNRGLASKIKSNSNLPAILASPKSPELTEKIIEDFPAILESLKELFDIIIINTGTFWNELQAVLIERDNKSLFIVDQRPSSINATKRAILLCERCGIATGSVLYAINRCSKNSLFTSVDVSYALKGAKVAEIMDGGIDVDECCAVGRPIDLIKTKNPFVVSLWTVLENIVPSLKINKQNVTMRKAKKQRRHSGLFKKKRA